MKHELELVKQFHEKFQQPVLSTPSLIPKDRSDNRYHLMHEEVQEYQHGVADADLANIAKELADIFFTTYGTILEHSLQDVMSDVFEEVCRSNMSKDYHEYKMIKGPNYFKADIKQFLS